MNRNEVDAMFVMEKLDRYFDSIPDHASRVAAAYLLFGRAGIDVLRYLEKHRGYASEPAGQ